MNCDTHRIQIELEENSRGSLTMLERASVMGDAILICLKRTTTRSDIGCWNNMKVVLERSEIWYRITGHSVARLRTRDYQ